MGVARLKQKCTCVHNLNKKEE